MDNRRKKCSQCGEEKPLGDFYRQSEKPDGLRPNCKSCHKAHRSQQGRTEYMRAFRLKKKAGG